MPMPYNSVPRALPPSVHDSFFDRRRFEVTVPPTHMACILGPGYVYGAYKLPAVVESG
jgi:hypothetical protein